MYSLYSRVRYSECDQKGRLSLVGMINYLQDCATMQSEDLGIGVDHLLANHYGWFISAWQIEIFSLPKIGTPIRVSTFCYDLHGQTAKRNFLIEGEDGEVFVRADSSWFVFDTEAQRIIKAPASDLVYLQGDTRLDMDPLVRKVPVEGDGTAHEALLVTKQHLDTNGHVNNAQSVKLALDAVGGTNGTVPSLINVQYKLAAHDGDVIVPVVHPFEGGVTVRLAVGLADGTADEKLSYAIVRAKA